MKRTVICKYFLFPINTNHFGNCPTCLDTGRTHITFVFCVIFPHHDRCQTGHDLIIDPAQHSSKVSEHREISKTAFHKFNSILTSCQTWIGEEGEIPLCSIVDSFSLRGNLNRFFRLRRRNNCRLCCWERDVMFLSFTRIYFTTDWVTQ